MDCAAPAKRLTDTEDAQHRMTPKIRDEMLRELYESLWQKETTSLVDQEEELGVHRQPSKRPAESKITSAKKPWFVEEEVFSEGDEWC